MKNRKIVVVAFLLIAVLLLGVGYAALTDTLDITGTADADLGALNSEFDKEIYFSKAVANQSGNTASVNADNDDKASFSAKSMVKGTPATFTFTIQNDSEHEVVVTPKLNATMGNTEPDIYKISSDWGGASKTIAAGGSITYTVTVELVGDPIEAISGSFLIELVAVATSTTP